MQGTVTASILVLFAQPCLWVSAPFARLIMNFEMFTSLALSVRRHLLSMRMRDGMLGSYHALSRLQGSSGGN